MYISRQDIAFSSAHCIFMWSDRNIHCHNLTLQFGMFCIISNFRVALWSELVHKWLGNLPHPPLIVSVTYFVCKELTTLKSRAADLHSLPLLSTINVVCKFKILHELFESIPTAQRIKLINGGKKSKSFKSLFNFYFVLGIFCILCK